ncbi:hypothetical protein DJ568_01815 [Mucilaginibacter hurinus]|uniref:Uncharacterized protein n=1 Tax=Mucilaginibacter hurinus TaxID=2201324 RepID=A0A367GV10_9SPHI|nr:hypothetical protein [Mucilaginibacter hurinus]RCH56621.1 hypothetical protein DJ568_01815 [Mucilaginibacter hurinus]
MRRITVFFIVLILSIFELKAQDPEAVYNRYLDLNVAMLEARQYDAIGLAEKIIPDTAMLPPKARVSFYNMAGKLFDDDRQSEKAINYYQKVVKAEPDYYVANRALGYLHLKQVEAAQKKLNGSAGGKQARDEYINAVQKALPYLEKAQACDPSPETLAIITSLYKTTSDDKGLNSLDERLKARAKSCVDILQSQ